MLQYEIQYTVSDLWLWSFVAFFYITEERYWLAPQNWVKAMSHDDSEWWRSQRSG